MGRWLTAGLIFAAVATITSACGGGGAVVSQQSSTSRPSSYQLKWADEFDQAGALGSAWTYDLGAVLLGGTVWGNQEKQYYTSDSQNVRVEDGNLVIQALPGVPAGAPSGLGLLATSARVKTDTDPFYNALGNSPHGFYEIRAQIPCVEGAWPAIWMMGRDGDWPARGEIDIMEWFGRYFAAQPDQVQSGVHTTAGSGGNSTFNKIDVPGLCEGFHLFQLHWQAHQLTMSVDDQIILTYAKPVNATTDNWPFDQSAHLLLNVAVGGNLGGTVDVSKISQMAMKVDYVRVWQP